jgi:hypothetical protein
MEKGRVMALVEAASAVVGTIKAAFDIGKNLESLHTSTEVDKAVAEMLEKLLTARHQAMDALETETALLKRVGELEAQVDHLKAWDSGRENYELKRFHPGVLAYVPKPEVRGNEPPHRLCYGCFQEAKKGVLQPTGERRMRYGVHVCTSCGKELMMMKEEMPDDTAPEPSEPPQPPAPPYDRYEELEK